MPRVNADILLWARENAGFAPEDAIHKLGIREARSVPPLIDLPP